MISRYVFTVTRYHTTGQPEVKQLDTLGAAMALRDAYLKQPRTAKVQVSMVIDETERWESGLRGHHSRP